MENILEKIGFGVLGAVVAGVGYLLKRWIERRPVFDEIEKQHKLLSLSKEMREQRVSLADLKKLEEAILNKSKVIGQYVTSIKKEIEVELQLNNKEFITQVEMNERACHEFNRADDKLKSIIRSLESHLDKTEIESLRKSQDSWEIFRKKQAEFTEVQYKGGSIQPLIYYSELERLTIERAASLQSEISIRATWRGE